MKSAHALLVLLMSSPVLAADPPEVATVPQPFFYGAAVSKHCLPNGARLHSHNLPGAHAVTLTTLVDTGDSPELAAIAARLWLRSLAGSEATELELELESTEDAAPEAAAQEPAPAPPITQIDVYPAQPTMAQRLLSIGARTEVVTTPDHTAFTTAVLLDDLDDMLALERQRLESPLSEVTEADLAAVIVELAAERVSPGAAMWRPLADLLSPADASEIDLTTVQSYVSTHWAPAKTTMNLTGDLSGLGNLDLMLRTALVDPPADPSSEGEAAPAGFVIVDDSCGAAIDDTVTEPPAPLTLAATMPADVSTPELAMVWPLPGSWRADHATIEALPALAEQYIYQGFKQTMVPGTTHEDIVRCGLLPGTDVTLMSCHLPLGRAKDASGVARSAVVGLDPLWFPNNLPTLRDRMPEIREGIRRNLLRRASAFADGEAEELIRAAAHARYKVEEVPYIPQISEVDELEAEPLLKMARKWLNPDRAISVVLTPDGWRADHNGVVTGRLPTTDAWTPYPLANPEPPQQEPVPVAEGEEPPEAAEVPLVPVHPLPERLPAEDFIALAATPQLDGAVRYTLDSGLSVLIVPRSGYPIVHTSLVHAGGLLREDALGLDHMAWDLSTPFSPNKAQFVPEQPLEGQAWWQSERRVDGWVRTLSGPQPNLEGLIYILRQTTLDTNIDDRSRNEYFFRLGRQEVGAWTAATRLGLREYFGDHPLGLKAPSKKVLKKVTAEANDWAQRVVQPDTTTLVIIGPVDVDGTRSIIDRHFADWADTGEPAATQNEISAVSPPSPSAVLVTSEAATAQVRMRCPVSTDGAGTDLLSAMLEARMWESAHGTLAPSTLRVDTRQLPGDIAWMSLYAEVDAAQVGDAVGLMRGSMASYVTELEGILTERIIREAFDSVIAADAELRRPRIDDAIAVALLASLTEGTRPPEEAIEGLESLMERLSGDDMEDEAAGGEDADGAGAAQALSEDALALLTAAAALAAEEPEEEEEEPAAADAEGSAEVTPAPVEVAFVRHSPTLDDARLALAAQHGIALHTTADLQEILIDQILLDQDLSNLQEYGQQLFDTHEQDLIDEIGACVGHEVLTVVGPSESIAPQLTSAGFTPITLPKKWWKE